MHLSFSSNEEIYTRDVSDCDQISLLGSDYIDLCNINWPKKPFSLHCNFRPNLSQLKSVETLVSLSFLTQYDVWRKNLPVNLTELILTCPESNPTHFNLDNSDLDSKIMDLFYISSEDFCKYNRFTRGLLDCDYDNIVDWLIDDETFFEYEVAGDPETRLEGFDLYKKNVEDAFVLMHDLNERDR